MPINVPVLDSVIDLGKTWIDNRAKRKLQKDGHKYALRELDHKLRTTQVEAEITRTMREDSRDFDYDQQILKNRDRTIIDELLIAFFTSIFAMHFIPVTQPYMDKGWEAMAIAPWFFHFTMIGIVISTLGLMRLFRLMIGMKRNVFAFKDQDKDVRDKSD
jgi:hypothetical protein